MILANFCEYSLFCDFKVSSPVRKGAIWKFSWQNFLWFLCNSWKYLTAKIWSYTVLQQQYGHLQTCLTSYNTYGELQLVIKHSADYVCMLTRSHRKMANSHLWLFTLIMHACMQARTHQAWGEVPWYLYLSTLKYMCLSTPSWVLVLILKYFLYKCNVFVLILKS